jgi:hypothetical protein
VTNLSKTQRNAVYEAVAATPLTVSECDFSDEVGIDRITHTPSGSQFDIYPDLKGRSFRIWTNIGDEPAPEREWVIGAFAQVLGAVTQWGNALSEWVDAPDLWRTARSGNAVIPGERSPDSDNTAFTPDEQAAISSQLREIKEAVKKTCELTAEQSKQIDDKFEEAEKASRRMGRKDWGLLFGGAIFSLILADVITPGVAGNILMMVQHGLGHLFLDGPLTLGGVLSVGHD